MMKRGKKKKKKKIEIAMQYNAFSQLKLNRVSSPFLVDSANKAKKNPKKKRKENFTSDDTGILAFEYLDVTFNHKWDLPFSPFFLIFQMALHLLVF